MLLVVSAREKYEEDMEAHVTPVREKYGLQGSNSECLAPEPTSLLSLPSTFYLLPSTCQGPTLSASLLSLPRSYEDFRAKSHHEAIPGSRA